jgi:SAM-dependent methyltransferase
VEPETYREQFELEDEHWWFKGRRAVIWALLSGANAGSGLRVLDAGCGTGRNLVEFGVLGSARGVDASADALEYCRRRGFDDVVLSGLDSLPFHSESFDLVLVTDVLEHLPDDGAALRELRRVTAPGGHLLATVPAYRWLWSEHDDAHHHLRRYTLRRLTEVVRDSGWEPVRRSYFNSTLLAPVAAVRVASRVRGASRVRVASRVRGYGRAAGGAGSASGSPRSDIRPTPPVLGRMLEQPMRLEAALIARGVRLPAGVSIGMLCRAGAGVSGSRGPTGASATAPSSAGSAPRRQPSAR